MINERDEIRERERKYVTDAGKWWNSWRRANEESRANQKRRIKKLRYQNLVHHHPRLKSPVSYRYDRYGEAFFCFFIYLFIYRNIVCFSSFFLSNKCFYYDGDESSCWCWTTQSCAGVGGKMLLDAARCCDDELIGYWSVMDAIICHINS